MNPMEKQMFKDMAVDSIDQILPDDLTWEFIKSHPEYSWNFKVISGMDIITEDIVKSHPEIDWSYSSLSGNKNISWNFVKSNLNKPWDDIKLSRSIDFTDNIPEFCEIFKPSTTQLLKNKFIKKYLDELLINSQSSKN